MALLLLILRYIQEMPESWIIGESVSLRASAIKSAMYRLPRTFGRRKVEKTGK